MTQVKRSWFFDSNPDATGTRFRTRNIPNEETYVNLVESVGFPGVADDNATVNKQGFVIINTDADAIAKRNISAVVLGKSNVLRPYQAPGTGILGRGGYEESNPLENGDDGVPVIGGGIKITGVKYTTSDFSRVAYQVELDLSTMNSIKPLTGAQILVMQPDGTLGLEEYNDGKTPEQDTIFYEHNQDVAAATWTVTHNFGWRPNINIEIGGVVVDTEWVHIDDNTIEVRFTLPYAGKAYCS